MLYIDSVYVANSTDGVSVECSMTVTACELRETK